MMTQENQVIERAFETPSLMRDPTIVAIVSPPSPPSGRHVKLSNRVDIDPPPTFSPRNRSMFLEDGVTEYLHTAKKLSPALLSSPKIPCAHKHLQRRSMFAETRNMKVKMILSPDDLPHPPFSFASSSTTNDTSHRSKAELDEKFQDAEADLKLFEAPKADLKLDEVPEQKQITAKSA